ncbi:hypothetical protein M409DRAFT_16270 [Zasmidium cellare ATCC 36951]|uniref:Uncharacterized protein n=1 Tax=Zasmidium cellare ATCC 36951 TaxID=1080233 RepID=A0A6A6D754_ZASCE|nr:uncharacterized protein M409DRAFT_16270 [Zasmidium cellare ATCC 36951]KAF2173999.1 hypothetical protein M409DRAFT_16270 [Zasmidium cellare ATCC 36951]
MAPWNVLSAPYRMIQFPPRAPPKRKPPPIPRYPTPLAGLMYAKCTNKQLHDSVLGRRVSASDDSNRRYLTGKLRQLDAGWTFRFTDLPPELRNMVYYELLKPDAKTERPANINILLVSKQLCREAEQILYGSNPISIEFRSGARTLFRGKALPQQSEYPALMGRIETVAAEYAKYPKITCLKVQHLRIRAAADDFVYERAHNRRLLALANVFGGSRALKTVEIQVYSVFPIMHFSDSEVKEMEDMLYPLTKLKNTDALCTFRDRVVTLRCPSQRVQRRLERRMGSPTPRPVDAIGTLADLDRRSHEIQRSLRKLPQVSAEFSADFDVFQSALEAVAREDILSEVVDYKTDVLFCLKVDSLRRVLEKLEKQWRKCKRENMWEVMHGAQGGIHWESTEDAEDWLDEQRATFDILRIGEDDIWI